MTEDNVFPQDTTSIAPSVLVTIAQLATRSVEGVLELASPPRSMNRLIRQTTGAGVELTLQDEGIAASLYMIVDGTKNVRTVSEAVQNEVARAFHDSVGMDVVSINVFVEDVKF